MIYKTELAYAEYLKLKLGRIDAERFLYSMVNGFIEYEELYSKTALYSLNFYKNTIKEL